MLAAARERGLLDGGPREALGARIPSTLLKAAKANSGLTSTTKVVEYALAAVAVEDDFAAYLLSREGSIPADIDLEFFR